MPATQNHAHLNECSSFSFTIRMIVHRSNTLTITVWCDNYIKVTEQETHQYHVTGRDVHVGVGGLFAPGGDAAPRRGADGLTAIAELRRHAVDPGGDGLRTLCRRFDRHALPTELLEKGKEGTDDS